MKVATGIFAGLLAALGFDVLRLIRVAIGPLALGELAKGQWRQLMPRKCVPGCPRTIAIVSGERSSIAFREPDPDQPRSRPAAGPPW